jgi:peptidoglycan/LPS O-acetylase OafA/YrhL
VRWLFDHVEARERRRDAGFPAAVVEGEEGRRALRRAAWGRALTLLGAAGVLFVLGVGPAPDTTPLAVLLGAACVALAAGLVLWATAAAALGRRELALQARDDD